MARVGLDARLYRNTGSYASPVWNVIEHAREVTLNLEIGEADASSRGTGGWKFTIGTLKDMTIEFEMLWVSGDLDFNVIRDAWLARTAIEFAILDGDVAVTGTQGPRVVCMVSKVSRNEPMEGEITYSITLKPTFTLTPPVWITI